MLLTSANQPNKQLLLPVICCEVLTTSNLSRYSLYYAEVCNTEAISSHLWRATQLLLKKCCSGASCWQHCVWFDWPKYEPPNPRQMRYCSTNWPVLIWLNIAASETAVSTKTCIPYKYCNKFEISLQTKLSYEPLFEEHTQTLGKSCYCIFFPPKNLLKLLALLPDNWWICLSIFLGNTMSQKLASISQCCIVFTVIHYIRNH